MESPMDMEDDRLPREWLTTTSEDMDSSEQIASLGRPPGFLTSRLPITPPRSLIHLNLENRVHVQDFDSDFSSNCAAAAAWDRITTKYELGLGGGRGTKRTRSNQENAEPGLGLKVHYQEATISDL
ncbi:hypothetical protein PQX77_021684 [Marasmius sp. AFHP31]|nr:hypothetical protein PQX77_021684 [Marasmius sp. AFHP31]